MSKLYKLLILSGDGIGPEVMDEVIKVLNVLKKTVMLHLKYKKMILGERLMIDMVSPYQMKH